MQKPIHLAGRADAQPTVRTRSAFLRCVIFLCTVVLLLSACGGPIDTTPPASSQPTTPPTNATSAATKTASKAVHNQVQQDPAGVLKYWTSDKMSKALNIDNVLKDLPQLKQAAANALKGNPKVSNLQLPTSKLPDIPSMNPQDLQDLLKQLEQVGQADTPTSSAMSASLLNTLALFNANKPNYGYSFPLSTVGKVFFSDAGKDYVCSGAAVNSNSRSMVNTAGHCVYGNGHWMSNWVFCPMYYNGRAPYGCWSANYLFTSEAWASSATISSTGGFHGNFTHDFGLAVVHPSSRYGSLVNRVGGLGYIYNADASEQFYSYGYPAANPYNGQSMKSCSGSDQVWDQGNGSYTLSIPCNMTGGSSGGPWIIKYNGSWYLNGHNSFRPSNAPNSMYSPYYDAEWYSVFVDAANSSPGNPA